MADLILNQSPGRFSDPDELGLLAGVPRIVAGVYRIRNTVNGKVYNGSSFDLVQRLTVHRSNAKKGKENPHLQAAFAKYGQDAFRPEVRLEVASLFGPLRTEDKAYLREFLLPNLLYWEQKYLDEDESYNPKKGYNICPKAGSNLGAPFYSTGEFGRKISRTLKMSKRFQEAVHSEEHRRKLSEAGKRRFADPAERRRVGDTVKERFECLTERQKMSLIQKEVQNRPEVKEANRKANSGANNAMYGRSCTEFMTVEQIQQWKDNLSRAFKGKHPTDSMTTEAVKQMRDRMSANHADVRGEHNPMHGVSPKDRMTPEVYAVWRSRMSEDRRRTHLQSMLREWC